MENDKKVSARNYRKLYLVIPILLILGVAGTAALTPAGQVIFNFRTGHAPFDYVVIILMENHNIGSITNSSAPYMTSLANNYSLAQHYSGTSHPSEGNYISLIGGSNFGHTSDGYCCWGITAPNIIDRIEAAGRTWQAFAEDATNSGTCSFTPPRNADHFAFKTFSDMNTAARCSHFLKATSSLDPEVISSLNSPTPPNYLWLTPNDCNNMHSCSVATGDNYLKGLVPKILSTTTFTTKKAALFITFDEGTATFPSDYVWTLWAGPTAKLSYKSTTFYDHYSLLKTLELAWNLPQLTTNDGQASDMSSFFM